MREAINVDNAVDIASLPPLQKIVVGAVKGYKSRESYKKKEERRLEAENRLRIEREEQLKEEILTDIYRDLINNVTLKEKGLVCKEVRLLIDRDREKELREVIRHKEFVSFNIRVEEVDKDLLRSFPKLKILIVITEKVFGGDSR